MFGIYKFENKINGKVYIGQIPIYKKHQKQWFLNGSCIDYPRLEE